MSAAPERRLAEWIHRTANGSFAGRSSSEPGAAAPWLRRTVEVLRVLTRADFRARYRAQALGVVWSLLNPLVMMIILSVVFQHFLANDPNIPSYPVFLLIGLVVWQWITQAVTAGTQSFIANADLVKRTVFRREALPIASVLSYFVNFAIESLIVLAFIPIFPKGFHLSPALLLLPVLLVLLGLLLAGVCLATSVLNVVYRDVAYIVQTALTFLYWVTGVMFPIDHLPGQYGESVSRVLAWNPAAAILTGLRDVITFGRVPSAIEWARMLGPTAILLGLGWLLFRRFERLALDHV